MSEMTRHKHRPCPCGCGELADECMSPGSGLNAFRIDHDDECDCGCRTCHDLGCVRCDPDWGRL